MSETLHPEILRPENPDVPINQQFSIEELYQRSQALGESWGLTAPGKLLDRWEEKGLWPDQREPNTSRIETESSSGGFFAALGAREAWLQKLIEDFKMLFGQM